MTDKQDTSHSGDQKPVLTPTEARQGAPRQNVRVVLIVSLVLIIVIFGALFASYQ